MKTNIHTWSICDTLRVSTVFLVRLQIKNQLPEDPWVVWGQWFELSNGEDFEFLLALPLWRSEKIKDWKLQKRWLLCIGSSNTKRKGIDWNVSHEWWICVSKHTVQSEKSSFFPAKSPDIMISLQSFEHFPSFFGEISHWLIFHWLSVSSSVRGSTLNCHRFLW